MEFERIKAKDFFQLMAATKKFGEMWQREALNDECLAMVKCLDRAFDDPKVDLVDLSGMFAELEAKTEGEFSTLCSNISRVILDVSNSIEVVEIVPTME